MCICTVYYGDRWWHVYTSQCNGWQTRIYIHTHTHTRLHKYLYICVYAYVYGDRRWDVYTSHVKYVMSHIWMGQDPCSLRARHVRDCAVDAIPSRYMYVDICVYVYMYICEGCTSVSTRDTVYSRYMYVCVCVYMWGLHCGLRSRYMYICVYVYMWRPHCLLRRPRVTCLIHMRDRTYLFMWHDAFIWVCDNASVLSEVHCPFWGSQRPLWRPHVTCLIHMCSITYLTWLIPMCDMSYSFVWHDVFICVCLRAAVSTMETAGDMPHPNVWRDSFAFATWLNYICDMSHSYLWHDVWIYVTWPIHTVYYGDRRWHDSSICVTWLIHVYDMSHSYVWHDVFIYVTRPIHLCVWHDSVLSEVRANYYGDCT